MVQHADFSRAVPAPTSAHRGGGGGGPIGSGNWENCGSTPGDDARGVRPRRGEVQGSGSNAFEITKRVAWLLRGQGVGLLIKNGGENTSRGRGYSFSISRICYPTAAS